MLKAVEMSENAERAANHFVHVAAFPSAIKQLLHAFSGGGPGIFRLQAVLGALKYFGVDDPSWLRRHTGSAVFGNSGLASRAALTRERRANITVSTSIAEKQLPPAEPAGAAVSHTWPVNATRQFHFSLSATKSPRRMRNLAGGPLGPRNAARRSLKCRKNPPLASGAEKCLRHGLRVTRAISFAALVG